MNNRSRDNIRLALRVLTTLSEKRPCDPEDVAALHRIAAGLPYCGASLDELACQVIHRERAGWSAEP